MIYRVLVKVITKGEYSKEDLLKKMDIFLLNNRITDTQYSELISLMNAPTT